MSIPNFFADLDVLNRLLKLEPGEGYKDIDLTLDLTDIPYWFSLQSDEKTQTMKVYTQMDLYSKNLEMVSERGSLVLNRESGEAKVSAPRELGENMGAFFVACRNLGWFIQDRGLEPLYADLDPEQAGILLTEEDGELRWKVVSGAERPDLTVQSLFGGVTKGRPYMDDFWERSEREMMDEEELTKAAEDGDTDAMEELARAYLNGDEDREIEQDFEKSAHWWGRLAEAGNAIGMFNLGLHYAKGCGVPRDFEKAAEWMDRSAAAGDEDAPAAAEKYRKLAADMEKANAGDAKAMVDLAEALMGMGGSLEQAGAGEDYAESLKWARKAADMGCPDAYWTLALAYEHGRGVEADRAKAVEYYQKGAEGGNAPCQHSYGCYLMRGEVVDQDPEQAFALFTKSAAQGYALAYRSLGYLYETGEYDEPDIYEELEYYEKACLADPSDTGFLRHVGYQYMNLMDADDEETWVHGVERAAHWLREAANRGDTVAAGSNEFEQILKLYKQGVIPACTSFGDCLGYLSGGNTNDTDEEKSKDGANTTTVQEDAETQDSFQSTGGTLKRYNGSRKHVVIPEGIKSVGDGSSLVFFQTGVETVVIPESVTVIDGYAFMNCPTLREVTIPDSVAKLGDHAFRQCSGLQAVEIPDGVAVIERETFWGCTGLKSVQLPAKLKVIEEKAFSGCTSLPEIALPNGAQTIEDGAFWGDESLQRITIPATVSKIGEMAFADCDSLTIHAPKGSCAERYAQENGIAWQEYDYPQAGAPEHVPAAAEPEAAAQPPTAGDGGDGSFDGRLSFDISEAFRIERSTDDEGKESFKLIFDEPAEDGKEAPPYAIGVQRRDMESFDETNVNLPGSIPAVIRGVIRDQKILFFEVKVLMGIVILVHGDAAYALSCIRSGSEEDLEKNAETMAQHLTTALNALTLDGVRGRFDPVTAKQLLSGDEEEEGETGAELPDEEFPSATPGKKQHTHLDFLSGTKSALGFLGGMLQVNQTGTEYAFDTLSMRADLDDEDDPRGQILGKAEQLCSDDFPLAETALEMSHLFRVRLESFDEAHDREQEIENGYIQRVTYYEALRSFAWTLQTWCSAQDIEPADVDYATLHAIVSFLKRRDWLNYCDDGASAALCAGDDIHVYFLPDALPDADLEKLLQIENEDAAEDAAKVGASSLDGLRRELAWMYPAIRTIYNELSYERDADEALEGDEADILYAWCSMTYAARHAFFTEDGPINNSFLHPDAPRPWEKNGGERKPDSAPAKRERPPVDTSGMKTVTLSYAEGKKVRGSNYEMDIPDGFVIEEGAEDRDFIAWLPSPEGEGHEASDFSIMAGREMKVDAVAGFATLEEFEAISRSVADASNRLTGPLFETMKHLPYPRAQLPGGISIAYDRDCIHANLYGGVPTGVRMMRVEIHGVERKDRPAWDQVITEVFDHIRPDQPVQLLDQPDDARFLTGPLTAELVQELGKLADGRKEHYAQARLLRQNAVAEKFKAIEHPGPADVSRLKRGLKKLLEENSALNDDLLRRCETVYLSFRERCPGDTLLGSLYEVLERTAAAKELTMRLNDEPITVTSAYAEALEQRVGCSPAAEAEKAAEQEKEAAWEAWESACASARSNREDALEQKKAERRAELQRLATEARDAALAEIEAEKAKAEKEKAEAETVLASLGMFKLVEKKQQKAIIERITTVLPEFGLRRAEAEGKYEAAMNSLNATLNSELADMERSVAEQYPLPPEPPKPERLLRKEREELEAQQQRAAQAASREQRMERMQRAIWEYLNDVGPRTVSDLLEELPELADENNQSVAAMCRMMVLSGDVSKYTEHRRTYFQAEGSSFTTKLAPVSVSSQSATPTAGGNQFTDQQNRNEMLRQAILASLIRNGDMNITELIERTPELEGCSEQYVSALCRALCLSGQIEKYAKNSRTYFRIL